jgi:hypothetical protein
VTAVYVFGGILAILLAAVVIAPLVERKESDELEAPPTDQRRKQRAIEALRELEFERETGKIPEDDYLALRARLAKEAIAARDALGETDAAGAAPDGTTPVPATGRCAVCDAPLRPGAKFCSRCGKATDASAGA